MSAASTVTKYATECAYEIDASWSDHSQHIYELGPVRVLVERFAPNGAAEASIRAAIERFRTTIPAYELVRYDASDEPTPGALIVAHRLGGLSRFELSVFFPVGDHTWTFRVSAPLDEEPACQEILEAFLQTFEPIEAS